MESTWNTHLFHFLHAALYLYHIETVDVFGRTPLANAVRYEHREICDVLLKYGAVIDESVLKEINEGKGQQKDKRWIYHLLKQLRKQYLNAIESGLPNYFTTNISVLILDCLLCTP
eukprot:747276_1